MLSMYFLSVIAVSITLVILHVMCFRKLWLRMKYVNFDFSAQSSSNGYNESNKPTPKTLVHIGSEKSLVEVRVPKVSFFTFSYFSF